jgi:RNA polymerase-binding transcription factor DksA
MTLLKEQLEAELKEAKLQRQTLDKQLDHKPEFGLGKGSAGTDSWEMTLARKQRLNERIAALQEALDRVHEGTYGQCIQCGSEIDPERLEILPTAVLCAACARAEESPASSSGGDI